MSRCSIHQSFMSTTLLAQCHHRLEQNKLKNNFTTLLCSGFVAESVFLYYAQEIVCLHDFTVPYHRPSRTNLFDSPLDLMWSLAPKSLHSKTCNFTGIAMFIHLFTIQGNQMINKVPLILFNALTHLHTVTL